MVSGMSRSRAAAQNLSSSGVRKTLTAWKRVQPNGFKSFLLAASHFSDVFVDSDIGQDGDAHEPMWSHAAVFLDEIIVESLHDREKCVFIRDRRIARFAREEQFRINAVLILLLQPLLRRPRADSVVEIQSHRGKCFQRFPGELIGSSERNWPSLFHDDVIAIR